METSNGNPSNSRLKSTLLCLRVRLISSVPDSFRRNRDGHRNVDIYVVSELHPISDEMFPPVRTHSLQAHLKASSAYAYCLQQLAISEFKTTTGFEAWRPFPA